MGDYDFDLGSNEDINYADYLSGLPTGLGISDDFGPGFDLDLSSFGESFGFDLPPELRSLEYGFAEDPLKDFYGSPDSLLSYYGREDFPREYDNTRDVESQEGGFYGNTPNAFYDPRTNLTTLYNNDGTMRGFVTHEDGEARFGGGYRSDAEAQEGGFYGNTPNATYDPKTNTTTLRNADGSTRTIQGPPGTNTVTQKVTDFFNRLTTTGPTKQDALLAALLGGLAGLLGKGSGKGANVGYKGDIPKFKAVRGKPGEGTKFIQAAGGGLMDLAQGGRPARYLRGGTDGMADKIKTDIDGKQPARLSHGEFVIPADVVSHLGNGNSDAGADVLYEMMDKVRTARTGTKKQGRQINPRKYTPA